MVDLYIPKGLFLVMEIEESWRIPATRPKEHWEHRQEHSSSDRKMQTGTDMN